MASQLQEAASQIQALASNLPMTAVQAITQELDSVATQAAAIVGGTPHEAVVTQIQQVSQEIGQSVAAQLQVLAQQLEQVAAAIAGGS
ncbi:hypothetical protein ACQPXB_08605 [Amycolatopsis sp. CA-161197]|uniref:hypothetical protein n=1 Tax=Amycolatopsis sp. CA-161197 TaxID=3239922 RepID=UPI003D94CD5A